MSPFVQSSMVTTPPILSTTTAIRTHMNHGGGNFAGISSSSTPVGPRQPLGLGFEVTKASQNVLRLLEATHGIHNYYASAQNYYQDTMDPCWHPSGIRLGLSSSTSSFSSEEDGMKTKRQWIQLDQEPAKNRYSDWIPTISWLQFSDERTALAKVQALDGTDRYVSLLRIDPSTPHMHSSSRVANDGWVIVREVVCPLKDDDESTTVSTATDNMISLMECLQLYLDLEHGGGEQDYKRASQLFSSHASLLTVGIAPEDDEPTTWSAPTGTFLEISRDTYLNAIRHHSPHTHSDSRRHDMIVQVDMTPGGSAAAATVKVGNGARTMVFIDHLLLGKEDGNWKILSKVFTTQVWDGDD